MSIAKFRAGPPGHIGARKGINKKCMMELTKLLISEYLFDFAIYEQAAVVGSNIVQNTPWGSPKLLPSKQVQFWEIDFSPDVAHFYVRSPLIGSCFVQKPPNLRSIRIPSGKQIDPDGNQNPKYTPFFYT